MSRNPEIEQAMMAWRDDPDRVLAGMCMSAETRADSHASHVRVDKKKLQRLAEEHPELFMGLVDALSPLAQDVLIQYYLLRRTQEQIGELLGIKQNALHYALTRAIDEIKGSRRPTERDFRVKKVEIKRGRWLGAREIPIDEAILAECFQPTNGNV